MSMIGGEPCDDYLHELDEQLVELMLPRGVLQSAQLGLGNKKCRHMLHQPPRRSWWEKLTGDHHGGCGFELDPRDQAGGEALNDLAGKAINVANTVTQSVDHVKGFCERLRTELGFYLGCVNLQERLAESVVPMCFPTPMPINSARFHCRGLRDVGFGLQAMLLCDESFGSHKAGSIMREVSGRPAGRTQRRRRIRFAARPGRTHNIATRRNPLRNRRLRRSTPSGLAQLGELGDRDSRQQGHPGR
jgi:hypothetical protein